jgi:hypothetical protein
VQVLLAWIEVAYLAASTNRFTDFPAASFLVSVLSSWQEKQSELSMARVVPVNPVKNKRAVNQQ